MVAGVLLIAVGGISVTRYVVNEVDENTAHNRAVLERSGLIEAEAQLITDRVLPAFTFLHSLDVAVTRHVAEFELFVLDFDRDQDLLAESLAKLEAAFAKFPDSSKYFSDRDRVELEEIVGVFVDITHEAQEVRSPNKLLQLLSDSEDIFHEFRSRLNQKRILLDNAVTKLGADITQDIRNARANVKLQQAMLQRLENTSVWGLSLLILFVLFVTILLFQNLQRRLGAIAAYAHAIAEGKYSSTIDFISSDKIGELAESVNHMGSSMATLVDELGNKAEAANRAARTAKRLAYYDSLTGLPNRHNFMEISEAAIEEAQRLEEHIAIVYMDLDDFKKVNDSFGHNVGDELLCAVADRLSHSVREVDAIARNVGDPPVVLPSRLGGDEFTFLIKHLPDPGEAKNIARRIRNALTRPYRLAEQELSITPSIGVAVFPDDGDTVSELLKNADMAMYQAKDSGRNNIKLFSAEIGERQINKLSLERDLSKALTREELCIHYQAKVDLSSGRIVGAEALLRWQHPQRGMVSPMDFVPLAEESGLIVPIGNWVLQHVCNQLAQWQSDAIAPVPIAINVSGKQFAGGDLVSVVSECLGTADICLGNIELEITETILMTDAEVAVSALNELKELGVMASLDDFGTGYSSLSYLKRFPLSTLKIDRSFVRDIETDVEDAAIVKAILALSKSLGLKVVAEGVENEQQAKFLRTHGCQQAQGYLFSKPIPAQEFTELLKQRTLGSMGSLKKTAANILLSEVARGI